MLLPNSDIGLKEPFSELALAGGKRASETAQFTNVSFVARMPQPPQYPILDMALHFLHIMRHTLAVSFSALITAVDSFSCPSESLAMGETM